MTDTTNPAVVGIRGGALPIPQVDADVVETLEGLLGRARDGQVVGLIYGTVTPQGHLGTGWAGAGEKHSMIAAGAILQARIQPRRSSMTDLFSAAAAGLRIIDLSAGNSAVWFGNRPPGVVAVDRRHCTANVRADTRALPFAEDSFDLAVFDPPHTNCGPNGQMAKRYGHSTMNEIRDLVRGTSIEASRCVRPAGLLALKWSDRDVSLTKIMGLMPEWLPLFGHHVAQRQRRANHSGISTTSWIMMVNRR